MDDYSKLVATRAAELIAETGDRGVVLAAQLGLFKDAGGIGDFDQGAASDPQQIGVWRPVEREGQTFYDRIAASTGFHDDLERWADVATIPPKSSKKRVVLLGESAARGFLLDPEYTPAMALESALASQHPEGVEVVDLAAHNLQAPELVRLVMQAAALQPDALVIFAGNNWGPGALFMTAAHTGKRQEAAAVLARDGVPGLKGFLEREFIGLVVENLQALPRFAQMMGLPVVIVVPEFNLADWRTDPSYATPWLRGDDTAQWWAHYGAAREAFEAQRFEAAAAAAREMVRLDGGTAHTGLELLGQSLERLGRTDEARGCFEQARDARLWDASNLLPRCYASIQAGLRRLAGPGVSIVDLPRVFRAWTAGEIPGRRLFLDYCHLSVEGIRVAMAATADALRAQGEVVSEVAAAAVERLPTPSVEIEATAHLLAAIHNAHWGPDRATIEHHLARAVALAPDATIARMAAFVEMQGRACPAPMTRAAATMLASGGATLRRFVLRYSVDRCLDELLVDAMLAQLREAGVDAASRVHEIRAAEWGVDEGREIDLLAPARRGSFGDKSWPRRDRGFYRAYTPASRFSVALARPRELVLTLSLRRAPHYRPTLENGCRVLFNGRALAEFGLRETWETQRFVVPATATTAGQNAIELVWPAGHWDGDAALAENARELEAGRLGDLSAPFGDLCKLRVAPAGDAGAR